jgi:aryl-alcohol dehydrogenase-like predicted oxidoreductase
VARQTAVHRTCARRARAAFGASASSGSISTSCTLSVQNRYNLADRGSDDLVDACQREGLAFLPWFPLATGKLAAPGGQLDQIARAHGATAAQVALA